MFTASKHSAKKNGTERRKDQLNKVVRWVADKNIYLSMVELESFRKMIASFDGTAKPICTRALKNRISDYDIVICKLVVTMMEGCDVSLTLEFETTCELCRLDCALD